MKRTKSKKPRCSKATVLSWSLWSQSWDKKKVMGTFCGKGSYVLRQKWNSQGLGLVAGRAYGLQKIEWWGAGMDICLGWGANVHIAQLVPLPSTASCFSKTQTGFTFLVLAHLVSPGQMVVKRVLLSRDVTEPAKIQNRQIRILYFKSVRFGFRCGFVTESHLKYTFIC